MGLGPDGDVVIVASVVGMSVGAGDGLPVGVEVGIAVGTTTYSVAVHKFVEFINHDLGSNQA